MLTLLSCVVLAAGSFADAGVPRLHKPALDAGVAVVEPTSMPSLPAATGASKPGTAAPNMAEVTDLRHEVSDLKSRASQLEQKAAHADAMSSQLDKLSKQISDLQTQLRETENRRTENERQAAERRQHSEQAIASIGAAQQQLAAGNPSAAMQAINYAEKTFTGAALANVQSARAALNNGDLASARIWLSLAVVEASAASR